MGKHSCPQSNIWAQVSCYNKDMKRIVGRLGALLLIPINAFAAQAALPGQVSAFFAKVLAEIINPLITLGFAVAIVYLAWAVLQYTMGRKI